VLPLLLNSLTQEIICWSCSAAVTCLVYTLTAPAGVSIPYGTCMGLVFGLCLYLLRGTLLEELYKVRVCWLVGVTTRCVSVSGCASVSSVSGVSLAL
jgi:hypothetical protein